MFRNAEVQIQTEQVILFILVAIALFLLLFLIIGLRGNVEDIGSSISNLVGQLF